MVQNATKFANFYCTLFVEKHTILCLALTIFHATCKRHVENGLLTPCDQYVYRAIIWVAYAMWSIRISCNNIIYPS